MNTETQKPFYGRMIETPESKPRSRTADPITSKLAAENSRKFRARHADIIYAAVKDNPGLTTSELAEVCPLTYHQIARRMCELVPRYVVEGEPRTCRVKYTLHHTYYPVENES